jgi:hypothetical protein
MNISMVETLPVSLKQQYAYYGAPTKPGSEKGSLCELPRHT